MVLSAGLARWAGRRPHALLAVTPGATAARLAVEQELAALGGVVAASAADADLLVVVGVPGPALADAVEQVWRQLPGPRARAQVRRPEQAREALVTAVAYLGNPLQEAEASGRRDEWEPAEMGDVSVDEGGGDAGGQGGRGGAHSDGGRDGHGHDHGGHGGGGMQMPGGLPMADRGSDRDGLTLDVLPVPLGPVLADWPAGVVVDLTVQGDVVQAAEARLLPAAGASPAPFWDDGDGARRRCRHAAAHLDSVGRLLAVAGWQGMACRVRRLRDDVLADGATDDVRAQLVGVARRMHRSWGLRWSTDGLGVLTDDVARQVGVSGPALRSIADGGDVSARWRCWLAEADRLLRPDAVVPQAGSRGRRDGARPASAALLRVAEQLMVGVDVAAARLVLASFDPDPDEIVAGRVIGAGG